MRGSPSELARLRKEMQKQEPKRPAPKWPWVLAFALAAAVVLWAL